MITIEASVEDKKVSELCLTDPYDGGSRERNALKMKEWEEQILKDHPNAKFASYFD